MTNPSENSKLTITITNIGSSEGVVQVLIFHQAEGFPDTPSMAFKILKLPIQREKASAEIQLPEGRYAVSAFHDHDGDGKMRTGAFGIPKDAYGFSNNAKGFFGPPAFEKAAFNFEKCGMDLEIRLSL
ncbi:DUF2141 domain-containing protein [Lunatibacter salilacus]|uniref:DUF2141 domain-containing protein n=1 Tax=Lunatibacter salilacus TaxID=2483804 RepID=UPI001F1E66BD|nr:DUF2141 domain-containing protein [Lunatibacter salilacus]